VVLKKILVTGSKGRIGQALQGLGGDYEIVPYDLPEYDATDYCQLIARLTGCQALVHLAFDLKREYSKTGSGGNPANLLMGQAALAAAAEVGIESCIMGSSVNAVRTVGYNNESYRTTKLTLESLTHLQAHRYPETQFTSIRFGAVNSNGNPEPQLPLRADQTWISNRDVCGLVSAIVEAPHTQGDPHQIVFGLSNRPEMPHSVENNFGWEPKDWFGLESQ
jgi:nucleoside-diphosphate-sugar epimerase